MKDQLAEKEKEVRLFQIKMKEFKKGENGLSLSDKQFLELEAMLANSQTANVFQRMALAGERHNGRNMGRRD